MYSDQTRSLVHTIATQVTDDLLEEGGVEEVLSLTGIDKEDLLEIMEDEGICPACRDNFSDNYSLHKPNDCSCEEYD